MSSFDIVAHSDFHFYVIDDLKKREYVKQQFQSLNEALENFGSIKEGIEGIPVLGIERGPYSLDLVHRVNGDAVLVPDYKNDNLADEMKSIRLSVDKLVAFLIDEAKVAHTYCSSLFDRTGCSFPVVVPLGKADDTFDNSYCADKRLKSISGLGLDSINQLLINGHGWVDYRNVQENPEIYSKGGFLPVDGVNVNYVLKQNYTGVDGKMDISVHDFSRMLMDINKEFSLMVYDRRLDNAYVVCSYSDLRDAVRAWYELPATYESQVVQSVGYSYQQVVFNGIGDDFEEITQGEAAKIYGFDVGDGVERVIAGAKARIQSEDGIGKQSERELN